MKSTFIFHILFFNCRLLNDTEIAKAQRDFEIKKAAYDVEVRTKVNTIDFSSYLNIYSYGVIIQLEIEMCDSKRVIYLTFEL